MIHSVVAVELGLVRLPVYPNSAFILYTPYRYCYQSRLCILILYSCENDNYENHM